MPIATAISAVIANQARVFHARRAAPVTSRRLAMDATMARKTSGGTIVRSRVTKTLPTVVEGLGQPVGVGHAGGVDASRGPCARATRPRTTPSARPDQDLDAEGREAEATGGPLRLRN